MGLDSLFPRLSPQSDNVRFPQSRIVLFSGLPPREDKEWNCG